MGRELITNEPIAGAAETQENVLKIPVTSVQALTLAEVMDRLASGGYSFYVTADREYKPFTSQDFSDYSPTERFITLHFPNRETYYAMTTFYASLGSRGLGEKSVPSLDQIDEVAESIGITDDVSYSENEVYLDITEHHVPESSYKLMKAVQKAMKKRQLNFSLEAETDTEECGEKTFRVTSHFSPETYAKYLFFQVILLNLGEELLESEKGFEGVDLSKGQINYVIERALDRFDKAMAEINNDSDEAEEEQDA